MQRLSTSGVYTELQCGSYIFTDADYRRNLRPRRRHRLRVEAVTDYAIYMLDTDGTITSWNAGAHRFKGYEEAEIIGEHFSRFYTEEDRAKGLPAKPLATAASDGKFEDEGWRVRKDGSRYWANVIIDPLRDAAGNLIRYVKITRDLTERKAAVATPRSSEDQFRRLDPLQITLAKPFLQSDLAQAVRAAIEDPKTRRVVRFRTSQS